MRIAEIHDLEDLRASELVETDCLHHSLRSRLSVSRSQRLRRAAMMNWPIEGSSPARWPQLLRRRRGILAGTVLSDSRVFR